MLAWQCDIIEYSSIAKDVKNWRKITSDIEVVNNVSGLTIDFENKPDVSYKSNQFSSNEFATVASEIKKLLAKGIIKKSSHEEGEIISPIFLREKRDGSYRLILNLK